MNAVDELRKRAIEQPTRASDRCQRQRVRWVDFAKGLGVLVQCRLRVGHVGRLPCDFPPPIQRPRPR